MKDSKTHGNEKPGAAPSMGLGLSAVIFCGAAILLLVGTHEAIPYLYEKTGLEHVLLWFLVAGLGVFTPLLL